MRDAILNSHGYYRLKILTESPPGGKALKAFRDALGVSLKQARDSALEASTEGFRGTYVETMLIRELLEASGIISSIVSEKAREEDPHNT
ncbi:hypothetical protein [Streptomyces diastatochromogenes]|uniref:hypothetical protein n=1 Tax=Streptomyces diastatochromogenes TaxID=42236 RepID=UPI001ABEFD25|nr:hypothetical protein [Streptomyces diastatochromogenes]MCZ0987224.1 hypothetical protein [Streptomyces diastatochromogenes]